MPDGPGKTIWGVEQWRWLRESLLASDADWKVLVSPTPIVGPDRSNKADNHANATFSHEGDAIREWFRANLDDRFLVIVGDRHWQYHSVHPETGLNEFSVGPASDAHAGGTPGEDPEYHRFHRVGGGFLSVDVDWVGERATDRPAAPRRVRPGGLRSRAPGFLARQIVAIGTASPATVARVRKIEPLLSGSSGSPAVTT